MFDGIISMFANALRWVVSLLPDSPFAGFDSSPIQSIMQYINWVVPVDRILQLTAAWLACVAVYSVYQVVLRWVKAI